MSENSLVSIENLRIDFRVDRDTVFEAVKSVSFDIPKTAPLRWWANPAAGKPSAPWLSWGYCHRNQP